MRFVSLLLKNAFRNKIRTVLTLASIATSLFLVATLLAVLEVVTSPPDTPASALRLMTRHRVSLFNVLSISHREKIARVEGVEAVVGSMWFGGLYRDKAFAFPQFAVDAEQLFVVLPDLIISDEEKEAFLKTRTGAIAGVELAKRYGWRRGDRIHLKGSVFRFNPELILVGIYEDGPDDLNTLYFHWDYFNEGLGVRRPFTGTFRIRASAVEEVPRVAERIDALFRNSPVPTKTETERVFVRNLISYWGNIRFLIGSICVVVIFTIVLVVANTMAAAIRERTREIALLKALGFQRRLILGLLLGESVFLTVLGGMAGALLAIFVYSRSDLADLTGGFIPNLRVSAVTFATCLSTAILVGLLSAALPAWLVTRRPVAEAIRPIV